MSANDATSTLLRRPLFVLLSLITLAFAGACGDSTLIVGEDDLEEPFPDIDGSFEDATDET
ncbi:MAG: hypothetical protein ABI183_20065, partial [Polyangiaceae bacterium]